MGELKCDKGVVLCHHCDDQDEEQFVVSVLHLHKESKHGRAELSVQNQALLPLQHHLVPS